MRNLGFAIALALAVAGCSKGDAYEVPTGSDVTVQKRDGVVVSGKLVEVKRDQVVLEASNGQRTPIRRSEISSLAAARPEPSPRTEDAATSEPSATAASRPDDASGREAAAAVPAYREVTLPAGTVLPVELTSSVASDTSRPEDEVRATLRRAVAIGGVPVLPAGTAVLGHVTDATRSARVKGRATIAFRFNRIDLPGDGGRYDIRSATVSRVAPATKKQDAAKIGGGAAGGAIIGGILGGGDGAAKGAVIGGAAGTGVVLSTRGKEVRLGPGASLSVKLTGPVTVRVRS
jgi:hypothetical protein